jgi:PAS domain S-box-containing protein
MDEKTIPLPRLKLKNAGWRDFPDKDWDETLYGRGLFEQTGECVFIIGLDFTYIAVNQQALNLLGYEEYELVGRHVGDVMSLEDSPGHEAANDRIRLHERILKRKDGSLLPVEISASVVYRDDGQPAYIQSVARDISERKNAEKVLRRQAQILSVISEAAAQLLRASNIEVKIPKVLETLGCVMDVSCCAVFAVDTFSADPSVRVCYKWQRGGMEDLDIPASVEPFLPEMMTSSRGYFSSVEAEVQPALPSGTRFVSIPINGNPGLRDFLGFFDDSRDPAWLPSELDAAQTAANLIGSALQRNRYEETIRLNEARNRIILDALPDLLIRINTAGVILDYSVRPDHPLFIHRDMISGKLLSQTWPPEIVSRLLGEQNAGMFSTPHHVEEFRLPYSNGTYESRLYPLGPDEALIVIRDITEQAELNEMKSDFINRASHELRTPLTSAMLMTELIQEGGAPEELDEYWRTLKSELNRQKILIDRLLIAGRLESGMMKLEREPMDLLPVLEESIRAVKPIAGKRRVSLQLHAPAGEVFIVGDKSGLEQVFINLINNAAKFSPAGAVVETHLTSADEEVTVVISDHGLGIPPEAIPHLFERFYRARNVSIAEIPGSGIGLYIVKSIVDELGGSISVDSAPGRGTRFLVSLKRSLS